MSVLSMLPLTQPAQESGKEKLARQHLLVRWERERRDCELGEGELAGELAHVREEARGGKFERQRAMAEWVRQHACL